MTVPNSSAANPPWYISGAAGSLGLAAEVTFGGQALSRITTAQQANPESSIRESTQDIYRKYGWRGYFVGYRWNLGMSIAKGFTRWSFNNALFSYFERAIPKQVQAKHSWMVPVAVGVGGAALETTLYLCPLESLKTREMTENWGRKTHMWKVVRSEGTSIFFKGWTALFPRQAVNWGTYLLVYDKYRSAWMLYRNGRPAKMTDKIALNFMTGATAAVLTTPLDLYKTQRQMAYPIRDKNIYSAFGSLIQSYGIMGVYRSLPIRICRSGFYAVFTFTVMDWCNALPARMKI